MRHLAQTLALCGLLLAPGLASADTFKVDFSAPTMNFSTTGTLTGTSNGDGSYTITGITGTGITGLVAAGDPFFGNDNLLFPTGARLLDVNGLAFTGMLNGLSFSVDIFSTVSGFEALALDARGNIYDVPATATLVSQTAVTPEPPSLLLAASGLFAAAFLVLKKRAQGVTL